MYTSQVVFSLGLKNVTTGEFAVYWQMTNVGCVYVCVRAQLCPTLHDPMDCSPPGSSVHGILLARILECGTISFFQGTFLAQGLKLYLLHLLHCRLILYHLSH